MADYEQVLTEFINLPSTYRNQVVRRKIKQATNQALCCFIHSNLLQLKPTGVIVLHFRHLGEEKMAESDRKGHIVFKIIRKSHGHPNVVGYLIIHLSFRVPSNQYNLSFSPFSALSYTLISTELWFQQDGATCHTARAAIDLLKDTFGDRLISRFGPVNWPPRSCDLTPLDYFLWGYVKSLVYADKPQTLDHFEDNIRRGIDAIRPQMLEKVIENWTSRLDYIRVSRGSHMPEIIFKM
ncbi:uncharacterized protein TNCV_3208601 [Trichonephila clavipes]|nr:uncharacterized protein TNCV_3208601 [Trichonephila clavipes]